MTYTYKNDVTPEEAIELAEAANTAITHAEGFAITHLMTALKSHAAKVYVAESLCEVYGWFHDADENYLDLQGRVMALLAEQATESITKKGKLST